MRRATERGRDERLIDVEHNRPTHTRFFGRVEPDQQRAREPARPRRIQRDPGSQKVALALHVGGASPEDHDHRSAPALSQHRNRAGSTSGTSDNLASAFGPPKRRPSPAASTIPAASSLTEGLDGESDRRGAKEATRHPRRRAPR